MIPSGMNDAGGPPPGAPDKGPGLMVAIEAGKDKGAAANQPDCVPLSALNMPDEQDQMQAPEVGDKVQYTIEGTIAKIEGDQAYIDRESINGQPVDDDDDEEAESQNPAEQPGPDDNADDMDQLQNMARNTTLQ